MSTTIDISELRLGCVLDAPIYHEKNVKLLGKGVTITRSFMRRLRCHGVQEVNVTDDDLAKLRGWRMTVNSPPNVIRRMDRETGVPSAEKPVSEARIDQATLFRYMATISQVGRHARKTGGTLKVLREAAQLAAGALCADYFGFGLNLVSTAGITVFLGSGTLPGNAVKLSRYDLEISANRALFSASMASSSPLIVDELVTDNRFDDEILAKL